MASAKTGIKPEVKAVREVNSQKKEMKVSEMKTSFYDTEEKRNELFKKTSEQLKLVDLTKTESRSYSTFSKDKLRLYMKNPMSNRDNIRSLSRYLYRLSQPYRRLIWYNASMIDLNIRSVVPIIDIVKTPDVEKTKKVYYATLMQLEKMDLANELLKMFIIAWREDAAYGVCYEDDSGFFILPLDGQYCRVSSINFDSTLNFAFDMSYFTNHKEQLEFYGDPFKKPYDAYQKDPTQRWAEIDPERTICIKLNLDDVTLPLPPYLAMFNSIIDLLDLAEIQSVKDGLSIYKLLVARLKPLAGAQTPDDFEIDVATAIEYYDKLAESLPDEVAACISPMPIEPIEFNKDATSDVNQIEDATKNLFNSSGGAQILNSSTISGNTAFNAAIVSDSRYATSSLLGQVQKWTNRYLKYILGDDHAKVKYLDITTNTKEMYRKGLLESATYGLPNRLSLNALNGYSEIETLSLQFLEVDVLGLDKSLVPMQSSHTQSSSLTSGGQTKDSTDLSDEGESSRDK